VSSGSVGSGLGSGDSLNFQVVQNNATVIHQTFTTTAAFESYFDDSVVFLGPENDLGSESNLNVQFLFNLTSTHPGSGLTMQVALGIANDTELGVWTSPTGGSWATPTDWSSNTLPNGPATEATFGSAISSPETVTLDENTTVGSIEFSNSNSYTIASGSGGFSLTLDNDGSAALVTVASGNHTISAPVVLTSAGLNVNVAAGQTLTLAGAITGPAPLTLSGTGTVKLGASIGNVDLTGLTISGGNLDINNNAVFVSYTGTSPIASIFSYLASGRNGGTWNGAGIDSSAVASLDASQTALVYAIGSADGADGIASGLASGEIEILPTLVGDAKLQGNVVFGDFQILAQYFGKSGGWDEGNFTYGATIDFGDFQLLAQDFGSSAAALTASEFSSMNSFAESGGMELLANPGGAGFEVIAVPEPASVGVAAFAGLGLLSRRRRSRRR
jgi:hypothetical protein